MEKNINRIGETLLKLGYISQKQLDIALNEQRENGKLLGSILLDSGFISKQDFSEFISTSQFSKLGERLIQAKLITQEQLNIAITFQDENGGRLGDVLISLGFIEKIKLNNFLTSYKKSRLPLGSLLVQNNEITETQLK